MLCHMATHALAHASTAGQPSSPPDVARYWQRVVSGVRAGHDYATLLGMRKVDAVHLDRQVRLGLSYAAFDRLQRNLALPSQTLAQLVGIPERTLARRREAGRLAPDESDRLLRLSRVFARAIELFEGDAEGARRWLTTPRPALGGQTPLAFARTDVGANEVDGLIGRLEHGLPS